MQGKQMTIFDFGVEDTTRGNSIMCLVQRPDGTTYDQEVQLNRYESPQDAVKRLQRIIGEPYIWRTINGRRRRILRTDAYIVVGWFWCRPMNEKEVR